jgi:hypothetical protein
MKLRDVMQDPGLLCLESTATAFDVADAIAHVFRVTDPTIELSMDEVCTRTATVLREQGLRVTPQVEEEIRHTIESWS